MEVILLKDVEKLGLRGDVVDVARGYARNYLLPRRLAETATPGRVAELRRIEAERAKHEARTAEQAQDIAELLGKTVLRFEVKAGPTGSLFGSVTPSDVADEIWRARKVRVDRRKIAIDPIKRIGRYSVPIELFQDVEIEVKTLVVPEGGELPPEEELAALEAAEAEAAAAAAAEARTGQEEVESAIADVLAEEEPEPEPAGKESPPEAEVGAQLGEALPDERASGAEAEAELGEILPDEHATEDEAEVEAELGETLPDEHATEDE
jgi:large subunit ribosomal protein L9